MGWFTGRRYGVRALVATLGAALVASAIVAPTATAADPLDPIFEASFAVTHPVIDCEWWPIWNGDQLDATPGAGPYGDALRLKTTLSNIHPDRSDSDYRVIYTYGSAIDGLAFKVDGSQGPATELPGDPGEVKAAWVLSSTEEPPTEIGVQLIGRSGSEWVLVHAGSVPVVGSCAMPKQQIAAPLRFVLNDDSAVVSGWEARLDITPRTDSAGPIWGGQTARRWICACDLIFDVSLEIDGEVVWSGTSVQPGGMEVAIPPYTEGKTAVVTITATPVESDPRAEFWEPVTVSSEPVIIQAPDPLVGNLHLFGSDPTPVTWPYESTCTRASWLEPGDQLWVAPFTGRWALESGTYVCYPSYDLELDYWGTTPFAVSDVTWYADGQVLPFTGNPITITDDMCGKVITAKQTWRSPRFLPTELESEGTEPIECQLPMTPVTPVIKGTNKVGGILSVDVAGWLPATATFAYQWHQTTEAAGTTKPISGATGATFTPTAAQAGFKVFVSVTATAAGYHEEERVSTQVSIPATAPTAPRSLKATAKNKAAALTWAAPSATGGKKISGYKVQKSTNGTSWSTVATTTAKSYTVKSLTNGTKYYFRVIAVNSVGSSPATAKVAATPATKPSAPRSVMATAKSKAVTLTWSAPKSTGGAKVTSYKVYVSTNGKTYALKKTVTGKSATISGLTKGKKYWFKVKAANKAGTSASAKVVTAKPK